MRRCPVNLRLGCTVVVRTPAPEAATTVMEAEEPATGTAFVSRFSPSARSFGGNVGAGRSSKPSGLQNSVEQNRGNMDTNTHARCTHAEHEGDLFVNATRGEMHARGDDDRDDARGKHAGSKTRDGSGAVVVQ